MAAALGSSSSFTLLRRSFSLTSSRPFSTLNSFHRSSFASCFNSNSSVRVLLPFTHSNPRRLRFASNAVSDEEAAAKAAAANVDEGAPTIFDKIIAKEIPSSIVYEDEKVLAFRDISPQAPVHVLIIPKIRDGLTELGKAEARHGEILGQLLYAAKLVAEKEGIVDGFRVVINSGPTACQSVYHLHLHVLGGRQLKWPPG
ncbi:14 kDa zinc-binding protein [Linum perenne]